MLMIAHRGASGDAPENTIAAMDLAIKQNCDGIEMDVQLTKDGQVIVCHDWTVDRTTNGTGEIRNLTVEEIKKLDAGSWFSEKFTGEKIPTLEEVINHVPHSLLLNIEIKIQAFDDRDIAKQVLVILEKYDRIENTIVSSFNHLQIQRIKKLKPAVKIGSLYEAYLLNPCDYFKQNDLNLYSFHACGYYINHEVIKELQDNHIKVYCWTINDKENANLLKDMGVDGIISNFPDMLK
ncbi:Glycerophosphodiester phosphodiesterase [Alkaliphilus metalliredigens QYMF]|uniref:Glycerophosphodiester phosphodiesterase n=1 Tax=Alkaliphilus metalliredigens (strain QYMF) TaxID=293826 RepID=A6TKS0_ALKMQ|nr:glycerophosphodiester phosphodiesterase [Alkaliphilus metalliredigens]ABR46788.1 Glycerophosphodiester phosphodiesterase [Alkaliphilus metalliredigens QYMF]